MDNLIILYVLMRVKCYFRVDDLCPYRASPCDLVVDVPDGDNGSSRSLRARENFFSGQGVCSSCTLCVFDWVGCYLCTGGCVFMATEVRKIRDENGECVLSIPKMFLKRIGVSRGQSVCIHQHRDGLVITPIVPYLTSDLDRFIESLYQRRLSNE